MISSLFHPTEIGFHYFLYDISHRFRKFHIYFHHKAVLWGSRKFELEMRKKLFYLYAVEQIVSDDDEIDYSIKPEFYDSDLDEKDELWVQKKRKGRTTSDAVLSCPGCFTTLCLECQRHEKYVTQYRAIFVVNCNIKSEQVLPQRSIKPKRGKRGRESDKSVPVSVDGETFKPVHCGVCSTEVGAIDEDEVYHFFNILPSFCLGAHLVGRLKLVA
ncbi:E2F-associated phosphoprotein-like isoform X2 [Vitis riparia]|uniref:E2F-associated phosphoprotein-like isoform X2 n=1 Tax=Vitis riparia TaxID=96939 RepID=UPI00155A7747|nr:E2F-associated phosphoprotein-like isoform X2 [Vitis riparia]